MRGSVTPRLAPKPLAAGRPGPCGCGCALTPENSYGFDVVEFARDWLNLPLDPWQRWLVIHGGELLPDGRPRFRKLLVIVARQNGKALDCGVDILTANRGWTTMGDIRPGDHVFHPDGKPVEVTHAFEPRTDRPCYRVTTTDGRTLVADGEHLWTVQDVRRVTKRGRRDEPRTVTRAWETLTTEQLLERGLIRDKRECAYRLPRQQALISPDVSLPIDPYLFGAWLGDGTSVASKITIGDRDLEEMVGLLRGAGARVVSLKRGRTAWCLSFNIGARVRDGFESRIRRMGVWRNKHIPDEYLTAGTDQRLALLQGLLDTDGSISKAGQVEFCSSTKALADGVLYLARSLGWRATVKESASTLNGVEVGRRWRVCFSPDVSESVPFRLRRKAERVLTRQSRGDERHAVSIRSIERVESRPVRCIKVDREDGLFLAGRDLMVTHNTTLLKVLTLFWLFVERWPLIVGQSTTLALAKDVWEDAQAIARGVPELEAEYGHVRRDNNDPHWRTAGGSKYKVAAATRLGGRGGSIDRLIVDELREHRNWDAYNAAIPTMNALPRAQAWLITNQGDDQGVVLISCRKSGKAAIEAGPDGDQEEWGLFEWSAPPGSDMMDPVALAAANPNAGHRIMMRTLLGDAKAALDSGDSERITGFKTEIMCMHVPALDSALDPEGWEAGYVPGDLADSRSRLAMVPELSPDGQHASLSVAATMPDGKVRVEVVASWSGRTAAHQLRRELPGWVRKVKPRMLGWMPNGPIAAVAAELVNDDPQVNLKRFGPGVQIEEIRSEVTAVCMGLAELVAAGDVLHSGQELLSKQALGSAKLWRAGGTVWVFSRLGDGHCDTVYGIAAAAHLARTMPAPVGRPRLVMPSS